MINPDRSDILPQRYSGNFFRARKVEQQKTLQLQGFLYFKKQFFTNYFSLITYYYKSN